MGYPDLLEAGLNQILWKQVPDEVQEGVQAADLLVLGHGAGTAASAPQLGVPWVDPQHQDDPQDGGDDGGGHVVYHGPATHPTTGAGIQTG